MRSDAAAATSSRRAPILRGRASPSICRRRSSYGGAVVTRVEDTVTLRTRSKWRRGSLAAAKDCRAVSRRKRQTKDSAKRGDHAFVHHKRGKRWHRPRARVAARRRVTVVRAASGGSCPELVSPTSGLGKGTDRGIAIAAPPWDESRFGINR